MLIGRARRHLRSASAAAICSGVWGPRPPPPPPRPPAATTRSAATAAARPRRARYAVPLTCRLIVGESHLHSRNHRIGLGRTTATAAAATSAASAAADHRRVRHPLRQQLQPPGWNPNCPFPGSSCPAESPFARADSGIDKVLEVGFRTLIRHTAVAVSDGADLDTLDLRIRFCRREHFRRPIAAAPAASANRPTSRLV